MRATCYAITMPAARGGHAPPEVIVVSLGPVAGPDGQPLYVDAAGRYGFLIDGDSARMIRGPGEGRLRRRCLRAFPLH